MKKNIVFILAIVSIVGLLTCQKDSICSAELVGETYLLSDTTMAYVSSYVTAEKIIFEDLSDNSEVEFLIKSYADTLVDYTTSAVCEEDATKNRTSKGKAQWIQILLTNQGLAQAIIIRLTQFPTNIATDEEIALFYGPSENASINYSIVDGLLVHFPQKVTPIHSVIKDSLSLGNKTFYDVIEPNANNPGFSQPFNPPLEIKYTKEQGIVYINDRINNRQLVFKRVE